MKRNLIVLFTLIFIIPTSLHSQPDAGMGVQVSGGVAFPRKPVLFFDYWKIGFNGGLAFDIPVTRRISVLPSVDVTYFTFDSFGFRERSAYRGRSDIIVNGGASMMASGTFNVKFVPFLFRETLTPYFIAGAGYVYYTQGDIFVDWPEVQPGEGEEVIIIIHTDSVHAGTAESSLVTVFGAGIDVPSSRSPKLFAEGQYGIAFTRERYTHYLLIKLGLRFSVSSIFY